MLELYKTYKVYFKFCDFNPIIVKLRKIDDKWSKHPLYSFNVIKGNKKFKNIFEVYNCNNVYFTKDGAEIVKFEYSPEYML